VLRLLALRKGETVLDLACGQGAVSRALHRAGAQVTGVDLSPRLIELARQRSPQAVRYLVGDVRRLDQLADASFDAATCVLAAQNLDPLEPMLAEAARLLRPSVEGLRGGKSPQPPFAKGGKGGFLSPGGRLVLVVTHPAFRIPRQSGWRWDESRKLMFREEARYLTPLKIPIDMRPFQTPGQQMTWTYHRPMQDYVNGLAAAGLWTNALEEWPSHKVSQPGPASRGENRAREEFPLFLALRAVKVGVSPVEGQ
jgi:SAM-dependent methyltransferase